MLNQIVISYIVVMVGFIEKRRYLINMVMQKAQVNFLEKAPYKYQL